MAIEFEHRREGGHLVVRLLSTEAAVEASLEFGRALAEVCDREQCHCVLLDHRDMTIRHGPFGHLQLAEALLTEGLAYRFERVAAVTGPGDHERYQDFELMSGNRGFNFRAFQSMEGAREWLESGSPSPGPRGASAGADGVEGRIRTEEEVPSRRR